MAERYSAVMGIAFLYQHVTVKSSHFGNSEHANSSERARLYGEHLAFRNIRAECALAVTLQTEERDVRSGDIPLESAAGEIGLGILRLKKSVLDKLILDRTIRAELAGWSIAAVEARSEERRVGKECL